MQGYRKLTTICCAAVLALGLAACGGGGDSSPTMGNGGDNGTPTVAQLAAAADTSLTTAKAAVDAVTDTSDDTTVTAADTAVMAAATAVAAASGADNHAMLAERLGTLRGSLAEKKSSRTAYMTDKAGQDQKDMVAKGKALYGKLSLDGAVAFDAGQINITGAAPALEGGDTSLTGLAKQDATVPSLDGWQGADYMKETGTGNNKVTAQARVYSNPDPAKNVLFISEAGVAIHGLTAASGPPTGDYAITAGATTNIGGDIAADAGTDTHDDDAKVDGTYMGASGVYTCSEATDGAGCTVQKTTTGYTLGAGWTFTPNSGAMLSMKDGTYRYFGWWLRKGSTGPTHASAFYGAITATGGTAVTPTDGTGLSGSATYEGKAAGKFAINNPRGSDSDAGHFTADAMLTAKFGTTTDANSNGLTGTIDGFRLNDGSADPGWIVSLKRARWDGTSAYGLSVESADTTADNNVISTGTAVEWSIDGTASPGQTGQWQAQLFDDDANDGSNVPTTAVGTFEAGFGSTHSMVGAFGAEKK